MARHSCFVSAYFQALCFRSSPIPLFNQISPFAQLPLFGQPSKRAWLLTTTTSKAEMDEERVEESPDASMIDSTQFPAISDQRPRRRFLGVQVPTSTVKPGFHLGKRLQRSRLNSQPQAIEILGEEQTGEGDFVFVFFDDNIVRRVNYFYFFSSFSLPQINIFPDIDSQTG